MKQSDKFLSVLLVKEYIQDYLAGTVELSIAAHELNVSQDKFLKFVSHYQEQELIDGKPKPKLESFNVMSQKISAALACQEPTRKKKKFLSLEEKLLIVEAVNAGGKNVAIAERFDVSIQSIKNVMIAYKSGELTPIIVEKVVEMDDMGISFEGELMVIKIPKKHLTKILLKDLI